VVLLDVAFVPEQPSRGFLLGTRQTLLRTDDSGRTWEKIPIPGTEEGFNYRLVSVNFSGNEGWIVGSPAILLYTKDGGANWERTPLSARLPGKPIIITALGDGLAEMTTDEGAIYNTSDAGLNWKAKVEETVEATLNRTVSSGISGASYYTGSFQNMARNATGEYVAVNQRGNFFLTWSPGDAFWTPRNRNSARRIQNMGWTPDGGLWMTTRGGGIFYNQGGLSEEFEERRIPARGYGLLDVSYSDENTAYCVGGSGTLFKSTDKGQTWAKERTEGKVGANLYDVKFSPDGTAYVLGNAAVLLRSTGN
jgi:photosystem II stability/assembly factor-like uncharacterized protein